MERVSSFTSAHEYHSRLLLSESDFFEQELASLDLLDEGEKEGRFTTTSRDQVVAVDRRKSLFREDMFPCMDRSLYFANPFEAGTPEAPDQWRAFAQQKIDSRHFAVRPETESESSVTFADQHEEKRLKKNLVLSHLQARDYNDLNRRNGNFDNNVFHSVLGRGTKHLGGKSIDAFIEHFSRNFQSEHKPREVVGKDEPVINKEMLVEYFDLVEGHFETQDFLALSPHQNHSYLVTQFFLFVGLANLVPLKSVNNAEKMAGLLDLVLEKGVSKNLFQSNAVRRFKVVIGLAIKFSVDFDEQRRERIKKVADDFTLFNSQLGVAVDVDWLDLNAMLKKKDIYTKDAALGDDQKFFDSEMQLLSLKDFDLVAKALSSPTTNHEARIICNSFIEKMDLEAVRLRRIINLVARSVPSMLSLDNFLRLLDFVFAKMFPTLELVLERAGKHDRLEALHLTVGQGSPIDSILQASSILKDLVREDLVVQDLLQIFEILDKSINQMEKFQREYHIVYQKKQWAQNELRDFEF